MKTSSSQSHLPDPSGPAHNRSVRRDIRRAVPHAGGERVREAADDPGSSSALSGYLGQLAVLAAGTLSCAIEFVSTSYFDSVGY